MLEPLPHQIEGARYFAPLGKGILADDMGLGKGGTFLNWLRLRNAQRTLVTGPKEITSNLLKEIPKWTVDRPLIDLRGYGRTQRDTLFEMLGTFDSFIAVLNFDAWRRDHETISRLVSLKLDSVVIDEAHHLNSGSTLAYKGLREIIYAYNQCPECTFPISPVYTCRRQKCSRIGERFSSRYCIACGHVATTIAIPKCEICGCDPRSNLQKARSVTSVLEATGTPVLNHIKNFFWLLSLVDESFRSERDFLDEYGIPVSGNKYVWSKKGKEKLVKRIAPIYLARTREDAGIRLPPQSIEIREYDFDKARYPEQWKAYQRLESEFKLDVESETLGITEVVVQLLRLRQMLIWPKSIPGVGIEKSFKMDIVTDLAKEFLEAGQRLVMFSHFKEPLQELHRRLGLTSVVYDGSTSNRMREAIRDDFSAGSYEPRWQAVLCNYRSAGEGLNLVGATQTIIVDEDWSPGKNKQAHRRTDRMGQTQKTGVHIPRILKTVDVWLADLNTFKSTIDSSAILEAMEKLSEA